MTRSPALGNGARIAANRREGTLILLEPKPAIFSARKGRHCRWAKKHGGL